MRKILVLLIITAFVCTLAAKPKKVNVDDLYKCLSYNHQNCTDIAVEACGSDRNCRTTQIALCHSYSTYMCIDKLIDKVEE